MCKSKNCRHRGKRPWNKGLSKEIDARLGNFGKHNKSRIGKTYEEIYGPERAKAIKEKMSGFMPWNKGISFNSGKDHWTKKNPERAKEVFEMHSKRMKINNPNFKLTEMEREIKDLKHSIRMSDKIAKGEFNPTGHYRQGVFISSISGRQYFSSSWELRHMIALDNAGIKWRKNHGIKIPYYDPVRNKLRNYVPDFILELPNGTKIMEEIKPFSFWKDPQTIAKLRAGILFCKTKGWIFNIVSQKMIETIPKLEKS